MAPSTTNALEVGTLYIVCRLPQTYSPRDYSLALFTGDHCLDAIIPAFCQHHPEKNPFLLDSHFEWSLYYHHTAPTPGTTRNVGTHYQLVPSCGWIFHQDGCPQASSGFRTKIQQRTTSPRLLRSVVGLIRILRVPPQLVAWTQEYVGALYRRDGGRVPPSSSTFLFAVAVAVMCHRAISHAIDPENAYFLCPSPEAIAEEALKFMCHEALASLRGYLPRPILISCWSVKLGWPSDQRLRVNDLTREGFEEEIRRRFMEGCDGPMSEDESTTQELA